MGMDNSQENQANNQSNKPETQRSSSKTKYIILTIVGLLSILLVAYLGNKIYFCFFAGYNAYVSRNTFLNWRVSEANKDFISVYKFSKPTFYDPEEFNGEVDKFVKYAQAEIKKDSSGKVVPGKPGAYHDNTPRSFFRTAKYHFMVFTNFEKEVINKFHLQFRSLFGPAGKKNETLADVREGDKPGRLKPEFLKGDDLGKNEMKDVEIKFTDAKEGEKKYTEVVIPLIAEDYPKLKEYILKAHELLKTGYKDKKSVFEQGNDKNTVFTLTNELGDILYEKNNYFYDRRPILEKNEKGVEKMKNLSDNVKDFYELGGQALWQPRHSYFYAQLLYQFMTLTHDVSLTKYSKDKLEEKKLAEAAGDKRNPRVLNAFSYIFTHLYPETDPKQVSFIKKMGLPSFNDLPEHKEKVVKTDSANLWSKYSERVGKLKAHTASVAPPAW